MDPARVLPDEPLRHGMDLSGRFLLLGLTTFREAARYVHQLPYGSNRSPVGEQSLFRDGCGTCTTKHGAVAALAAELGLPLGRWYGLYKLDESIVAGSGTILERYRLPFVPVGHCFLVYNGRKVDLTAGNNHGKKRDVTEFLTLWSYPPDQCPGRNEVRAEEFVKELLHSNPAFGRVSLEEVREVQAQCMRCMRKNRASDPCL